MALNVGLDVSVDIMQDWKGIWEGDSTKAYLTNDWTYHCILDGVHTDVPRISNLWEIFDFNLCEVTDYPE
jgi:hypothetical protein